MAHSHMNCGDALTLKPPEQKIQIRMIMIIFPVKVHKQDVCQKTSSWLFWSKSRVTVWNRMKKFNLDLRRTVR